ncbi:MAG TPA: LysM domain-containing protein [Anaerolineales bacterium]
MTACAAAALLLAACIPAPGQAGEPSLPNSPLDPGTTDQTGKAAVPAASAATPLPARPNYKPGELVEYIAQTGDTLPALAARFNTTVSEIFDANPIIPRDASTMPAGLPMKIPVYYRALWATPYHSLPDQSFVNGPLLVGFSASAFVADHAGWLRDYRVYAGGAWRTGAGMVDYIAMNYSISPRLLLAILEYQTGALSESKFPPKYSLGFRRVYYESPYLQLVIAANTLNNGYYGWRSGGLLEFDLADGSLLRPDPWQNAGSVAVQYYFAQVTSGDEYAIATGPSGLARTYAELFGDPWQEESAAFMPGSLQQPELTLPFPAGHVWSYTGAPHTGWGTGEPFAAVDFAPPSEHSGCFVAEKEQFAVAMADGLVTRSDVDGVILDLDEDGDERTGWVIFYLHLATPGRVPAGRELKRGDPMGYPSCEGGHVTGTHVHIARKYNGEWILADGPVAMVMDGWVPHNGPRAYEGTLTRLGLTVTACECSDVFTSVKAGLP